MLADLEYETREYWIMYQTPKDKTPKIAYPKSNTDDDPKGRE